MNQIMIRKQRNLIKTHQQSINKFFNQIRKTMQKILFTLLFVSIGLFLTAQAPTEALKLLEKKRFDKAKEMIDKLTADPKTATGDAWYIKSQVYDFLSNDTTASKLYPDAANESYAAFLKTYEVEPKNKFMLLDQYKTGFLAYQSFANKGAKLFNENDFENALIYYSKALEVSAFLNKNDLSFNGLTMPKVDTSLLFMAGYAAFRLEKKDVTLSFFKQLVDAGINTESDYSIAYQFVSFHYKEKDDAVNFKKYTEMGKLAYPNDRFFKTIVMDYARDKNNKADLFKGYEDLLASEPDSLNFLYAYASEVFNYVFENEDTLSADAPEMLPKVVRSLKKCIAGNYETFGSNYLLGQLYFNHAVYISKDFNKIKGTKPEDVKARADIKANYVSKFVEAIPFLENAATYLENIEPKKISEKSFLRNAYVMLEDCYKEKGDNAKAAEYSKKFDSVK